MRKLFSLFIIATFLLAGTAYAEMSAQMFSTNPQFGSDPETPVYIMAINDSGSTIEATSYSVVIIDTTASGITTAGYSSGAVGAYFTSTTTEADDLVMGVTIGEEITDGSLGRICVRGVTKVDLLAVSGLDGVAYAAGATVATTTTAWLAARPQTTNDAGQATANLGVLLNKSSKNYPSSFTVDGVAGAEEGDNNVWFIWLNR